MARQTAEERCSNGTAVTIAEPSAARKVTAVILAIVDQFSYRIRLTVVETLKRNNSAEYPSPYV